MRVVNGGRSISLRRNISGREDETVLSYSYASGYSRDKGYMTREDQKMMRHQQQQQKNKKYNSFKTGDGFPETRDWDFLGVYEDDFGNETVTSAPARSQSKPLKHSRIPAQRRSGSPPPVEEPRSRVIGFSSAEEQLYKVSKHDFPELYDVLEEQGKLQPEEGFFESIFGCTMCGCGDDTTTTTTKNNNGNGGDALTRRGTHGELPSTEQLSKVLRQISEAQDYAKDFRDGSTSAIDFAVEYLVPIQLLTKWAAIASKIPDDTVAKRKLTKFKKKGKRVSATEQHETGDDVNDHDPNIRNHQQKYGKTYGSTSMKNHPNVKFLTEHPGASFLRDIELCDGIQILVQFLKDHIQDGASVVCTIRAIFALLVDLQSSSSAKTTFADDITATSNQITNNGYDDDADRSDLDVVKSMLMETFVEVGGVDTVLNAWKLHDPVMVKSSRVNCRLQIKANAAVDEDGNPTISFDELRHKSLAILETTVSSSSSRSRSSAGAADVADVIHTLVVLMDDVTMKHKNNNQQIGGGNSGVLSKLQLSMNRSKMMEQQNFLIQCLSYCCAATKNIRKVQKHLTLGHVLDLVDIATSCRRVYPTHSGIATRTRIIWKWAATY